MEGGRIVRMTNRLKTLREMGSLVTGIRRVRIRWCKRKTSSVCSLFLVLCDWWRVGEGWLDLLEWLFERVVVRLLVSYDMYSL